MTTRIEAGPGLCWTRSEAGPGLCWTSSLLDYMKTHSRVQPGVSTGPLQLTTNSNFLLSGVCVWVSGCVLHVGVFVLR